MIKERIIQILENKGIAKENFYKKIGMSSANFRGDAKKTPINSNAIENILSEIPDINLEWLLTGDGKMLQSASKPLKTATHSHLEGIPLIPIEAMAGFGSAESTQVFEHQIQEQYIIPEFKGKVDYFIRVTCSSMYPKYNSGDIVACKKIEALGFVQWNKTYVLDTTQGALVKRLMKSSIDGNIICRSDNKDYPDFELNINEDIHAIALIVGVIRFE